MKLINLKDVPLTNVSHDPQILKQVMINTGMIPGLTKFSKAVVPAGQSVSPHTHDSMYEILFFLTGRGELLVNGKKVEILSDQCIVIEPGEVHSITKVLDDIELVYFGIEKCGMQSGQSIPQR